MKLYRQAGNIKAALFVGGILLILGLFIYTQSLIENLRKEGHETVRLYSQLIVDAVTSPDNEELDFIFREIIQKVTFPLIYSDQEGIPVNWRNLPDEEDVTQESVSHLMKRMDIMNVPIPLIIVLTDSVSNEQNEILLGHLHYGDSRLIRQLQILPYVEIGAVALFIFFGFVGFQVIRNNEKRYIWFGMARETAHQLGTPISSLMGWVERLRDHPDKASEVAKDMASDIKRLLQISDRFSRMGSVPKRRNVDIQKILSDSVSYFEKRLPQVGKNIQLILKESDPINVKTSSALLSWAVENILKNAIDSIDQDKGEIIISTIIDNQSLVISIQDNGIGIDHKDFKNIFRPGYSTKKRGWGLGLSLTRRIIEEFLGGKIQITSAGLGMGSTFKIILPISD